MLDFIPDTQRLSQIFSQALAPTFFLGAVAAFVSLMASRLSAVIERVRTLNAIPGDDAARAYLKADLDRLRRRARFLHSGILASLRGGLCATLLLAIIFATEFLGLKYAYWPAPGSEDTELGVFMELEVGHRETEVYARVQA